jgi:hypothetical protein
MNDAVGKAGDYCHAKGQKLQVVPNAGANDVRFRCVPSDESSRANTVTEPPTH